MTVTHKRNATQLYHDYFNNGYFIIFPWKQFFKTLKMMLSLKLFQIIVTANTASCYLIELPTKQINVKTMIVKASGANIE